MRIILLTVLVLLMAGSVVFAAVFNSMLTAAFLLIVWLVAVIFLANMWNKKRGGGHFARYMAEFGRPTKIFPENDRLIIGLVVFEGHREMLTVGVMEEGLLFYRPGFSYLLDWSNVLSFSGRKNGRSDLELVGLSRSASTFKLTIPWDTKFDAIPSKTLGSRFLNQN